jgi:hypothetical protein
MPVGSGDEGESTQARMRKFGACGMRRESDTNGLGVPEAAGVGLQRCAPTGVVSFGCGVGEKARLPSGCCFSTLDCM